MSNEPIIAVLCGGTSAERDVSLVTGRHVADSLAKKFSVQHIVLEKDQLPKGLSPDKHIIFPALHGAYGEDGTLQNELEAYGFAYAGCNAQASHLCMHKVDTKERAAQVGVPVTKHITFCTDSLPDAATLDMTFPSILKPVDSGSSVGLYVLESHADLASLLPELTSGGWMIEPRIRGRELTVGILNGVPQGIVEIVTSAGVYDFKHKYAAGNTEYKFPAKIEDVVEKRVLDAAQKTFGVCGCRDFARIDFILEPNGDFWLLEVNTLPGMTPTSLLPKSAHCKGIDFDTLCQQMLAPALERFQVIKDRNESEKSQ